MFWFGRLRPSPESLANAYRRLNADAAEVFPIRYVTDVPLETGPLDGVIAGFHCLVDKNKGWLWRETVVEVLS